jgi:hypothetical protein
MSEQYLILKFNNARLFKSTYTKDRKPTDIGYAERSKNNQVFIKPITAYQVSNVLHVLFNERPVPSMREVFWSINPKYFEMAQNSYLKIDSVIDDKTGEYLQELSTIQKSMDNSWLPKPLINWTVCRNYMGSHFEWLISDINALLNIDAQKLEFQDMCNQLRNVDYSDLRKKVIDVQRKAFMDYIDNTKDGIKLNGNGLYGEKAGPSSVSGMVCAKNRSAITIINGIDYCFNLSGEIVIPIDESDVPNIYKNSCTILYGGDLWIDDLVDYTSSFDDYERVGDISTEKITLIKKVNENKN